MERGADELLREILPTGPAGASGGSRDDRPRRPARGRDRDARWTSSSGPSMTIFERTVDQIAPAPPRRARWSCCAAPSTRARPRTSTQRFARPAAASTSRSARSGSPRGTRWRSSATLPQIVGADDAGAATGRRRCSAGSMAEIVRTAAEGGGAREALHEHLALHEVRGREPVLHDGPPGRAWTSRTSSQAIRRGLPARADLPGPGFAAGPCLFKDTMQLAAFTSDHFPLGQAAMLVNEGLPAYIVDAARAALRRRCAGGRSGSWGWPSRRESRRHRARRCRYKLRKLLAWAGADGAVHRPVRRGRPPACRSTTSLRRRDILILGAPHRAYRDLRSWRPRRRATCGAPSAAGSVL